MNELDRRRPSIEPHAPRESAHRRDHHRVSLFPLATRMVALVILCMGAIGLMTMMPTAEAQFTPAQNFGNSNYNQRAQQNRAQQNRNTFGGTQAGSSIPTIPAAARTGAPLTPQESATANELAASESAEGGFAMPAIIQKIAQGGWLMLPLVLCSLIVLTLSLERMIALRRSRVIPRPFVRRFTECVEDGQLSYDEATAICDEFDCPVAEVFQAAVRRWGRPMFEVEQAVMDAGDRVADGLKRFLRVFHAISNVAPLLGLLGTVLGMIQAFEVISSQESMGRPEMLASGISVALITTAGGLSVAIPAYLAYMYFSSKSDRYLGEIDKLCQKVVDCISAEALESTGTRRQKKRAA